MADIIDISDIHKNHTLKLERCITRCLEISNDKSLLNLNDRSNICYVADALAAMLLDEYNKKKVKDAEKWSKKMVAKHGDDIKSVVQELNND